MGAASFWRGAWYILDDNLFPDNEAASAAASWSLGVLGLSASQGWVGRLCRSQQLSPLVGIYVLVSSCVLIWRGTWVGWDVAYERLAGDVSATDPGHATRSGLLSHSVALAGLLSAGLFTSVLAPPAAVSIIRDATVHGPVRHIVRCGRGVARERPVTLAVAQQQQQLLHRSRFMMTNRYESNMKSTIKRTSFTGPPQR